MKTHQTRISKSLPETFIVFVTFSSLAGGIASAQTNGTWNADAPGNRSDTTKWSSGTVASGATFTADFTADFSTLNITNATVDFDEVAVATTIPGRAVLD